MTIGVTGGIGSGKSTVCTLFESWGAKRLDADQIGHLALEDSQVKQALIKAFGQEIARNDGSLDRREIGRRAFVTDATRKQLTDVVWPEVGRRLKAASDVSKAEAAENLVIEASVLLERGDPEGIYDAIVVVTAEERLRIRRTKDRIGLSEAEVRDRMRHQMSEEEKIKRADHVIVNDGTEADLEVCAREVWRRLAGNGLKE